MTKDVDAEEFLVLEKAVTHYNTRNRFPHTLGIIEVLSDDNLEKLVADFKNYEAEETAKQKEIQDEYIRKQALRKSIAAEKAEAKKIKKLAKELSMTEEQVKELLASKEIK